MSAPDSAGLDKIVVELTHEQQHAVERVVGITLQLIAKEYKLSDLQIYLAVMYLMGGLAASSQVAPEDKATFSRFRKGYDEYLAWAADNIPGRKQ
jgi:hypothetical protein